MEEINLTPEEIEAVTKPAVEAAIRQLRETKWHDIERAQYWWDVNHPKEAARYNLATWSQAYLQRAREVVGPQYVVDEGFRDVLNLLALYFTEHPDFEAAGYHHRKGLFIIGGVGVGKTTALRIAGQQNSRKRFGIVSCRTVASAYQEAGPQGLSVYAKRYPGSGVCFDDLGTEPTTLKNYGNEVSPIAQVLLDRYDEMQAGRLEGCETHMTTNLNAQEVEQLYGPRVWSRLHDMFNFIVIPTSVPDRRRA
ncbi:ATPase [Hymenobacter coalescens]